MKIREILEGAGGTYVAARFSEGSDRLLSDLQKTIDVPNPIPADDFHVTIVYSRVPIEWEIINHDAPARIVGYRIFGNDDKKCLVLELDCESLTKRFDEAMDKGATFDFPSYTPHITLSYDIGDFSPDELETPDFPIMISHEFKDELR